MALIICKTCGKKVSDTAKACIHCGEPLLAEEVLQTTPVVEEKKEENINSEEKLVKFKSLGELKQEELVHAFWEADKIAKHYQKKRLILEHLQYCLWFPLILVPGITMMCIAALRFKVQSPELVNFVLAYSAFGFVAFALKAFLFKIIKKLTVDRKTKRFTYEKRFQVWAKNEKQIDYTPVFINKKDKQIFAQIDIDTFKL